MTIRTVKDLIQELEDLNDPDAPVRLPDGRSIVAVEEGENGVVRLVPGD